MVWKKGESGNPSGVNHKRAALARRMEGLTIKAADALEYALDNGTTSERITAAKEVLDRAIGKAKQQQDITVKHQADGHLSALVALAASTAARIGHSGTNVPTIEAQPIGIVEVSTRPHISDSTLDANEDA